MEEILNVRIEKISIKKDLESQPILNNISFTLPSNKIFTIIGKNGSGKSTLFNAIINLLNKNFYEVQCEILFGNKNIYELDENELLDLRKEKIKYVIQDSIGSFDPLKKLEYYFTKNSYAKAKIEFLLEYFLLPDFKSISSLYPYEISGGMAQRISIVLALLAEPDLIILDEPTSALDVAIANLLLIKLKEFVLSGNRSVLLVTQDISFAEKISDQIALLDNRNLSKFLEPAIFFNINKELKPEAIKNDG